MPAQTRIIHYYVCLGAAGGKEWKVNMEDLEKILKQLYLVSGLNMSIFDINQILLASYPHEKSKFCQEIEKNKASDHCFICDINAMNHVKETGELYVYQCHFGLSEAIMPLYSYGALTGYLMMGQAVIGTYRNYSEIINKSKPYFENEEELRQVNCLWNFHGQFFYFISKVFLWKITHLWRK